MLASAFFNAKMSRAKSALLRRDILHFHYAINTFKNFERIFRILDRLDPENRQSYYFFGVHDRSHDIEVTDSVQQWLDVALSIDRVVRIWLEYVFEQAALSATNETTLEWLRNSVGIQGDDDTSIIFRLLKDGISDADGIENDLNEKRELLISRINRLEAFADFNRELLSVYERELEEIIGRDLGVDKTSMDNAEK